MLFLLLYISFNLPNAQYASCEISAWPTPEWISASFEIEFGEGVFTSDCISGLLMIQWGGCSCSFAGAVVSTSSQPTCKRFSVVILLSLTMFVIGSPVWKWKSASAASSPDGSAPRNEIAEVFWSQKQISHTTKSTKHRNHAVTEPDWHLCHLNNHTVLKITGELGVVSNHTGRHFLHNLNFCVDRWLMWVNCPSIVVYLMWC